MEEASWTRNHGGDIMEEASWMRNHGGDIMEGAIMEEASGGGIHLEEASGGGIWMRNHGGDIMEGGIMEEASGGGIMDEESWRRHPGTISTSLAPRLATLSAAGGACWYPLTTPGAPLGHHLGTPGVKARKSAKRPLFLATFADSFREGCTCNPIAPVWSKHTFSTYF